QSGWLSPAGRASGPAGSERERLRAPVDLGGPVLGDCLDRRPRQRLVGGEQPPQRLHRVESAIEEQRQRAGQAPDDLVALEERSRDAQRAAWALDREQLALTEQLLDPAHGKTKPVSNFGNRQPVADD